MDVEEGTPPLKRIKSEQAADSPSGKYAASNAPIERIVADDAAQAAAAAMLGLQTAAGQPTIKEEQVGGEKAMVLDAADESGFALSEAFKLEPGLAEAPTSTAARSPPTADAAPSPPPTKKKKSTSNTKKESSASSSTSKSKKTSSSSKKSSTHADPQPSRRPKVEIHSPPPTLAVPLPDEDEDNALYCTCQRRQDDVIGGMIMCDRCEQWYHYRCMGITEDDAELVDQFICPPCHDVTGEKTTYKAACAREGCRRAAGTPFSKYCSERCGVLMVTGRMGGLRVDRGTAGVWAADRRVEVARKTEGFTVREEGYGRGWEKVQAELGCGGGGMQRLGLAGMFNLMVQGSSSSAPAVNGLANGDGANGIPAEQPSTAPSAAAQGSTQTTITSPESSSATSLLSIDEQITIVSNQILAVDLEQARLNAKLDRLDQRTNFLHLVSDRVPLLPPVGASTTTVAVEDDPTPASEDEEMPQAKKKKKKTSKNSKKSSTADTSTGPRCGYDQHLHYDDALFDAFVRTAPISSILAQDLPLPVDADDPLVCGLAKRKCRRHLDWSNLCEQALDAEKAVLNGDAGVLTQMKLGLGERLRVLEAERKMVGELREVDERRERRRREERDRELAVRVAGEGSRRGGTV